MPWTYSQQSGELRHNGALVGSGYSGAGRIRAEGRNNSAMQAVAFAGPIPQGRWTIGPAHVHPQKGPVVMNLDPVRHNALGRADFRIHGNNEANNASQGCIILPREIREAIAASGDNVLDVTP